MPKLILIDDDGTQLQQWNMQTKYNGGMVIIRETADIFIRQLNEGLKRSEDRRKIEVALDK